MVAKPNNKMLKKSEDDDGYCSRSSLDSPVQVVRMDLEVVETDGVETSAALLSPSLEMNFNQNSDVVNQNSKVSESDLGEVMVTEGNTDCSTQVIRNMPGKPVFILNCTKESNLSFCLSSNLKVSTGMALPKSSSDKINLKAIPLPVPLINGASVSSKACEKINSLAQQDGQMTNADDDQRRDMEFESCCHGNGDFPAVEQSSETMMDQKQIVCDHTDACRKQMHWLPEAGSEQLPTPALSASSVQQPIWSSSTDDVISVNNELKSDESSVGGADVSADCVVGQSLRLLGSCGSIGPEIRSASPAIASNSPCVLKTVRFVGKKLTDGLQSDNVKTDLIACTEAEVHDVQRMSNAGASLFVRDRHGTAYYKRVVNLSAHSKNVYLVGSGNKGLNQITQVVKNSELKSSHSSPATLEPETNDNVNFKIMTVIPKFRNASDECLSGVENRVLAVNRTMDTSGSLYSNVATKLNETSPSNPACTNGQQLVVALNSGTRMADGSAALNSFGSSLQEKRLIQAEKWATDIEYVGSTSLINSPTVIPKKLAESSGPVHFVSNKAKFSPYETTKNSKKTSSTSARTGNPYVRGSKLATPHSDQMSSKANYVGQFELHPLIDHDYCKFSAFNAEIQSGIILMSSESGTRFDRQNLRKGKGTARSKMQPSVVDVMEHKRKYNKRKITSDESNSEIGEDQIAKCATPVGGRLRTVKVEKSLLKQRTIAEKVVVPALPSNEDKNYVKIPGCYQNEYVYYATTRSVGRTRKRMDVPTGQTAAVVDVKPPTTTSLAISAFDWYKEMAHTDKSSKFGDIDVKTEDTPLIDEAPVSESDVADLVMQLLPKSSLDPCQVDKFRSTSLTEDSFLASSLAIPNSSITADGDSLVDMNHVDLNQMVEEIRNMFNSMGEAELKLLETHLERSQDGLQDISCLSDFNRDNFSLLTSSNSNLLDVDEINDGDLLTADIGNMNVILNDLTSQTQSGIALSNDTPMSSASKISNLTNLFDKVENCSNGLSYNSSNSVDSSDVKPVSEVEFSSTSAETLCPPELTTVNMFWNDLPGLLMGGKEYVRLVDIHKQIMPAKDTGILKKRCHIMGLEVANCTELQRDFLIRYMNAAKSKSKVVITKDTAIVLIGFYVNPKSRSSKFFDELLEEDFFSLKSKYFPRGTMSSEDPSSLVPGQAGSQLVEQLSHFVKMPSGGSSVKGQAGSVPYKSREEAYLKKDKSLVGNEGVVENESFIPSVDPHSDVKRSERLRHKHVSYSDMVHGSFGIGEKEKAEKSTNVLELKLVKTPRKARRSRWRSTIERRVDPKRSICKRSKVRRNLAKLLKKQKNVRLGLKEKRWLGYHKDGQSRGNSKALVTTGGPLHRTVQTRMSSLSTVAPEEIKKWGTTRDETKKREVLQDETKKRGATQDDTKKRGVVQDKYRKRGATQGKSDRGSLSDETSEQGAKNVCKQNDDVRPNVFHTQEHCYAASPAGGDQGVDVAIGESLNPSVEESLKSSIPIRHCDWTRRHSQDGDLFVEMYRTVDSKCIRCCSCHKFVSIAEFLEHLHSRRHNKMLIVLNPQKLFLRGLQKSAAQLISWRDFKSKRVVLESESRQPPPAQSEMFAIDDHSVEVKQEAVESTELKNPRLEFFSIKSESSNIEELSENEVKSTEAADFKEAELVDLKTCKSEIEPIESESDTLKLQPTNSETTRLDDQTSTPSKSEYPSLNLKHPKHLVPSSGSQKKKKLENTSSCESKQKLVDPPEMRRTRQSDSKMSDARSKLLNKKIMCDKKLPTRHSERVVNRSNSVSMRRSTKAVGGCKRSNNAPCMATSMNKLSNSLDVGRRVPANRFLFLKTRGRPTGRPLRK